MCLTSLVLVLRIVLQFRAEWDRESLQSLTVPLGQLKYGLMKCRHSIAQLKRHCDNWLTNASSHIVLIGSTQGRCFEPMSSLHVI